MVTAKLLLIASVLVGTWNLQWFPSGRAEHRASQRVEQANIKDAAETIRSGFGNRKGVVLFFQEMRSSEVATNLVAEIGHDGLQLAVASAFRERDRRLGWQQVAIATDYPVLDSSYAYWKRSKGVFAPRGYAYALLDCGADGVVACYAVHLKSNYGAKTDEQKKLNSATREICTAQIVEMAKKLRAPDGRKVSRVVVAGDFNADSFTTNDADEATFKNLLEAEFSNCWTGAPLSERGTHPGRYRWPDSTLDYVFHRGFARQTMRRLSPLVPLSDHRMAWVELE